MWSETIPHSLRREKNLLIFSYLLKDGIWEEKIRGEVLKIVEAIAKIKGVMQCTGEVKSRTNLLQRLSREGMLFQ